MPVDDRDPTPDEQAAIKAMRKVCGWALSDECLAMLRAVPLDYCVQRAINEGAFVKFRRQGLVEGYELRSDRLASENETP